MPNTSKHFILIRRILLFCGFWRFSSATIISVWDVIKYQGTQTQCKAFFVAVSFLVILISSNYRHKMSPKVNEHSLPARRSLWACGVSRLSSANAVNIQFRQNMNLKCFLIRGSQIQAVFVSVLHKESPTPLSWSSHVTSAVDMKPIIL
jgi:hypothetical protein